jgi:hypothetical protein
VMATAKNDEREKDIEEMIKAAVMNKCYPS